MTALLDRITIFPIKSLPGLDVTSANVLPSGALEHDRRFALIDSDGRFINGKRTPAVHQVRADYDLASMTVRLDGNAELSLIHHQRKIGEYLSNILGIACGLAENTTVGFPDDTDSPGPTLISTATLTEVAGWFAGLALPEARLRFRANLEVAGDEPFWEDRLIGPGDATVPFQIGESRWLGVNPCQRCVVPSRDPSSGAVIAGFQKTFAAARERHLPAWAPRDRFNHFYRLAVNTRRAVGQPTARLQLGQAISLE